METVDDFAKLLAGDDAAIDLARTAFAIAMDDYPGLDVAHYLAEIDGFGLAVRDAAKGDTSPEAVLHALDHTLFVTQGFSGNADDYYNPDNSYLNQVIDRRQGIPITLCVLYMEVARRVGLVLEPVGFPSHFLLSHDDGTKCQFIDPFHQGRRLDEADLRDQLAALVGPEQAQSLFPQAIAPVPRLEVVARMLRNLKVIHARARDWARALPVSHRLVALEGGSGSELRDRGRILEHLEAFGAAAADYECYLEQHPDAEDAVAVAARLDVLRTRVMSLN